MRKVKADLCVVPECGEGLSPAGRKLRETASVYQKKEA